MHFSHDCYDLLALNAPIGHFLGTYGEFKQNADVAGQLIADKGSELMQLLPSGQI